MTYNFSDSIVVGTSGEKKIFDYLKKNPHVKNVKDVRDISKYQSADIDCIAIMSNGDELAVEIKTDTYTSGNFFFETESSKEAGTLGCLYKTKAQFLFYYFVNYGELYIIDMPAFLAWFEENKHNANFKKKEVKNNSRYGGTYTTVGYTFSKRYMEQTFKRFKKVSLE